MARIVHGYPQLSEVQVATLTLERQELTNPDPNSGGLTYRAAGVDIDAGDELVERIKPLARKTLRPEVLGGIGGFAALVEIGQRFREPVLVSGTDGVGTKLLLAFECAGHATVGIDLVAMSVNDILVQGAEPLFFLDYFACGKLAVDLAAQVIAGIALGCEQAGCALIGGETAEMPDMYSAGEYDLAGFAVGVVEKSRIIDGREIQAGDVVIGIASSGAHSNGFSLIRKILRHSGAALEEPLPGAPSGSPTLAQLLLEPTRIYVRPILSLLSQVPVKGMAHITGGGLLDNLPRVLPSGLIAELERSSWPRLPLFDWLQQAGGVAESEMLRVFNCGIGFVVVVAPERLDLALGCLAGQGLAAWPIGRVRARHPGEHATIVRPQS